MDRILPTEDQAFGIWLARELAQRRWTQTELAARLAPFAAGTGSKQSHVSKWLHGQRHPGRRSCAAIAAALGVPLATVLAQAGRAQPDGLDDGPVCTRLVALVRSLPEERLARVALDVEHLLLAEPPIREELPEEVRRFDESTSAAAD